MEKQVILMSDVHLSVAARPATELSLCAVLELHPSSDVVFVGDVFEFATAPGPTPELALRQLLDANPTFVQALRRHALRGASISFVVGNHDAPLADIGVEPERVFGFSVTILPWFVRIGAVHVEHGHVFDADNAPLHPLAAYHPRDEPLGVILMRQVVVRLGAYEFAHAHHTTPVRAMVQAVRVFGWRLPWAVVQTGIGFTWIGLGALRGRWGRVRRAQMEGQIALERYAAEHGMAAGALSELLSLVPAPTHAGFWPVCRRLYVDWVVAFWSATLGCAAWLTTGQTWLLWVVILATLYILAQTSRRGQLRYAPPVPALGRGAACIADVTGARRVVFGHTHVEEDDGVYFNLGSFGYPAGNGRPYAILSADGGLSRHHLVDGQQAS